MIILPILIILLSMFYGFSMTDFGDGDHVTKIKLKFLKRYYSLNPDRYHLLSCGVQVTLGYSDYERAYAYLKVGFLEFVPFLIWSHSIKKRAVAIRSNAQMTEYLNAVQSDIDKVRQDVQSYIIKGKITMDEMNYLHGDTDQLGTNNEEMGLGL